MITDLQRATEHRAAVAASIDSMSRGLLKAKANLRNYDFAIQQHELGEPSDYDYEVMKQTRAGAADTVATIEKALEFEFRALESADKVLADSHAILKAHDVVCNEIGHMWVVDATYASGNIKRRHCNVCSTVERVG